MVTSKVAHFVVNKLMPTAEKKLILSYATSVFVRPPAADGEQRRYYLFSHTSTTVPDIDSPLGKNLRKTYFVSNYS